MRNNVFILLHIQGWYFLFTGIWAVVDIESFQAITGYKTDIWLVKTVGLLITSIALSILTAVFRKELTISTIVLAISSMSVLTIIDIVYVLDNTIAIVYMADAFVELILILLWTVSGISWLFQKTFS